MGAIPLLRIKEAVNARSIHPNIRAFFYSRQVKVRSKGNGRYEEHGRNVSGDETKGQEDLDAHLLRLLNGKAHG